MTTLTCLSFFALFCFSSDGEIAERRARLGWRTWPVTKSICSLALATFFPSPLLFCDFVWESSDEDDEDDDDDEVVVVVVVEGFDFGTTVVVGDDVVVVVAVGDDALFDGEFDTPALSNAIVQHRTDELKNCKLTLLFFCELLDHREVLISVFCRKEIQEVL